jgi:enolase
VEVDVITRDGLSRAAVPSGASTGKHEALELRDGGKRYGGKGVLNAVANVNKELAKELKGMDVKNQEEIDNYMIDLDGSKNKSLLGANAILGISLAVCKAGALSKKKSLYAHIADIAKLKVRLPVPSFNVINGGMHAENALDIQEFMIMPVGAKKFSEAVRMGSQTYYVLKKIIQKKYGKNSVSVGDEGGFAPPISNMDDALDLLMQAIDKVGYSKEIKIAMDCAASEFFSLEDWHYHFEKKRVNNEQLLGKYLDIAKRYPIVSIEDPFDQDDFDTAANMTLQIGDKVQIVGDDALVTNVNRIQQAMDKKSFNALLLKVNQIGTVTEAISAAKLAKKAGWGVMVSHRSGETEDTFIADLAAGLGNGQIKSGAPCRSERVAKYNQLLRIEEELGRKAKFAGKGFRKF